MFFSPLEQFDVIIFFIFTIFGYDFTFLSLFLPFIANFLLLMLFYFFFKNSFLVVPNIWQYIFEMHYLFVLNIVKQQIGNNGFIYFPFIFVIFNFIFFCNIVSLFPFGIALTSHIILILFLSISLCFSIFIIGLIVQNLQFLRIFIPQSPFLLLFLLIPIEIFSYLIRMFSLAIRLSANILAGHTLVYIISTFISIAISISFYFYFFTILFLFVVLLLELVVAFLQAYVFTTLICIYINDSVNLPNH
jgi:ATP synthase subunit 6